MKKGFSIPALSDSRQFLFWFLVVCSVFTGHWIHYDLAGAKIALFIFSAALIVFLPKSLLPPNPELQSFKNKMTIANVCYGVISLFPLLAFFAVTWKFDFPFGGDNSYHGFVAKAFYSFVERGSVWLKISLAACGVLVLLWSLTKQFVPKAMALVFLGILFSSYLIDFAEVQMRSYPAFYYVTTVPFQALFDFFNLQPKYNAFRFTNAMAPVVWLWFLRPLFLGKWPDFRVFVVSVFFFWRWPNLYYGIGFYPEPWALVFVSLALETCIERKDHAWISLPLLGVATMYKENPVFFFPFLFLFLLCIKKGRFLTLSLVGLISATPFLMYVFHRQMSPSFRSYGLGNAEYIFSSARFEELLYRFNQYLYPQSLAFIFCILIFSILLALSKNKRALLPVMCLLGVLVLFNLFFFHTDVHSITYEGYSRYNCYWLLFSSWALSLLLANLPLRFVPVSLLCLWLGLTSNNFVKNLSLDSMDKLNALEHYNAPVYYPIWKALDSLPKRKSYWKVTILTDRISISDIARFYGHPSVDTFNAGRGIGECQCKSESEAFITLKETPQNLLLGESKHFIKKGAHELLTTNRLANNQCIQSLSETCESSQVLYNSEGVVWAMVGYGIKNDKIVVSQK